jgi:hypothetical protein
MPSTVRGVRNTHSILFTIKGESINGGVSFNKDSLKNVPLLALLTDCNFLFFFFFCLYVLPSESLLSFGDSWFLCYLINIGFKTKLYCIKMRRFSRDFSITIKEKRFFFLQNKIKYTNNFNFYLLMVRKYHSFETRLTRQNPVKNPIATR